MDNPTTTPSTAPFSEAEDEDFVCPDCNGCGEVQCVNLGEDYRSDTLPCPTCIAREYASERAALLSAQSGTDVAKAVVGYDEVDTRLLKEIGLDYMAALAKDLRGQKLQIAANSLEAAVRILKPIIEQDNSNG